MSMAGVDPPMAGVSLLLATLGTGLTAGMLYAFAHTVMPGLGSTDDRTFAGAFQAMDRKVVNPWFLSGFLGGPLLTLVAVLLHLGPDGRPVLPWASAALVLHAVAVVVTMAVNVPLNNRLQAAGPPDRAADLADVRARFERRWVRANVLRTVAAVGATAALGVALLAA